MKNKGLNVLSLFDGIACAKLALDRAKIKVNNYYASEIDKYAIKVAKANHPDIIHIGDVKNVNWFGLPNIDLLIGGSPCQGFSFAGKGLNFNDPRSQLFFEYVRILKEIKPKYFLLENVVMKKEHQDVISNLLGVQPIMINSALVSAQNRKRLYWTNIPGITQPKDKGIVLKDIIDVDNNNLLINPSNTYNKMIRLGNVNPSGTGMNGCVFDIAGKAPTLTTNKGEGDKIGYSIQQRARDFNKGGVFTTKSPTLSSSSWQDNNKLCIQVGKVPNINFNSTGRVYSVNGKSNTLLSSSGGNKEPKIAIDEIHYRKLSVYECCRLQTLPDGYFDGIVSNSQAFKALGNCFTVDVIVHMLLFML